MALVVADRVKETTTSTGTGAITLGGAEPNFRTFSSVLSDADTTYYAIIDDNNLAFEVGLGTYASSGNTITRTTVLASSNSNNAVNFSAGTKDVFLTYPADKSVNRDASGNVSVSGGVTATSFTGPITATQVDLTGQGDLRLQDASGGQYVALQAPATVGSSFTFTLPSADGSANQLLQTDGSGNLSFATINPAPSFTATADGAITNGAPLVMTSAGKLAAVDGASAATNINPTTVTSDSSDAADLVYDPDTQRIIYFYRKSGAVEYLVYTTNSAGNTLTASSAGAGTVLGESANSGPTSIYDTGSNKVLVAYERSSGSARGAVRVGTVDTSDDTVSWGTEATFGGTGIGIRYTGNSRSISYNANANKFVIIYTDSDNSYYLMARVGTVSGTNVTFGTAITLSSSNMNAKSRAITYDKLRGRHMVAFADAASSSYCRVASLSISGTDLTIDSNTTIGGTNATSISCTYHDDAEFSILTYGRSSTTTNVAKVLIDASGNISATYLGGLNNNQCQPITCEYHAAGKKVAFMYSDYGDNYKMNFNAGELNAAETSMSFDTDVTIDTNSSVFPSLAYHEAYKFFLYGFRDGGDNYPKIGQRQIDYSNLTTSNYVGGC